MRELLLKGVFEMQEVLRMYPPVGVGQVRVSFQHDLVLAGKLAVPKGTLLWVPHHGLQNVSFNWDEPDRFQPGAPCVHTLHCLRSSQRTTGVDSCTC